MSKKNIVEKINFGGSFNSTKITKNAMDKVKADKEIDSQVDKYVEKRKVPINKDLTIDKSEEGKAKYKAKKLEREIKSIKGTESSESEFKANEGDKVNQRFKKDVGIVRRSQMTGKQKAQAMAKERIKSGKSIQDVKDANIKTMKLKATERNKKFQAAKKEGPEALKKLRDSKLTGRERAQQMAKERIAAKKRLSDANIKVEDYTPYDIVLEYLLSTEQVATIEEANYVMTEMDSKTIQSIISD